MKHPREQLTDYLTGDLSAAEARRVEAHLDDCAACRAELERMDAAYVAMIDSLPPERPPERVWAGIEARVANAPRASEVATADRTPAPPPPAPPPTRDAASAPRRASTEATPTTAPPGDAGDPPVRRLPAEPARPRRRDAWFGAVAASLLLAVAAGWWGLERAGELRETRAALEELRDERAALAEDRERLARLLADDAVVTRPIAQTEESPVGSVLLLPDGRAIVVMRDPPGAGLDFQAWGVRGDQVTSLGAFDGLTYEVPTQDYEAVAISLEPDGGSDAPTDVLGAVPTQ